jgi:hypothetical protein
LVPPEKVDERSIVCLITGFDWSFSLRRKESEPLEIVISSNGIHIDTIDYQEEGRFEQLGRKEHIGDEKDLSEPLSTLS